MPGVQAMFQAPLHSKFGSPSAKENKSRVQPLLSSVTPGKCTKRFAPNPKGSPLDIVKKDHSQHTRGQHIVNLVQNEDKPKSTTRSAKNFYDDKSSPPRITGWIPQHVVSARKLEKLDGITVTVNTVKKDAQALKPLQLNGSGTKASRSYSFDASDEEQHKPKKFKRDHILEAHMIGFKNQGATCYLNSVLQALSGLENFYSEVLEEMPMMSSQLCPLQSLFRARKEGKDEMVYVCLREIHSRFALEKPDFKSTIEQQDLDEFLTLYLDLIDSQIKEKRKELEYMKSSPTLVENNFSFKDTEKRICKKCQNEVVSEQSHNVLYVCLSQEDITSHSHKKSVQELVESTLEGPWNDCDYCNEYNHVKTSKKFTSLPRTLLVVMMRYNNAGLKLETPVEICPYLNLENYISSDCQPPVLCSITQGSAVSAPLKESVAIQTDPDPLEIENPDTPETDTEESALKDAMTASLRDQINQETQEAEDMRRALEESMADLDPFNHKPTSNVVYRLSAVVNHYGDTPNSGHYKCDVYRKEKKQWYNYNDMDVELKMAEDVIKGGEEVCYLLVYEFDGQYDAFKQLNADAQVATIDNCLEKDKLPEVEDVFEFDSASSFLKSESS